jgi:chitin disaccharide deacetylase
MRTFFYLRKLIAVASAVLLTHPALSADKLTIQEKLGYPPDAKLLIIHGDDLGMAHSANAATFKAMQDGVITSASIMMPTPWVLEVVRFAEANRKADLGVHLTLTAEWKHYKWGPLAGKDQVPSLVTKNGTFHESVADFAAAARLNEVEKEIRAQIDHAKALGIDVTHLDAHMGVLSATPELKALYVKIGNEYGLPVRLHRHAGDDVTDGDIKAVLRDYPANLDAIYGAPPETFPNGMQAYYQDVLRKLKPGLNMLVLHLAFDEPEAQAITVDHPLWGARWRQIDYDWAMNPETKRIIEEESIILLDSRRVRDRLFPRKP